MSTLPSNENPKQPPSIYTVMLFLSMLFLLVAVIAMFVELRRWGPEYFRTDSANPGNVMVISDDDQTFG